MIKFSIATILSTLLLSLAVGLIAVIFVVNRGVNDTETYYDRISYLKHTDYHFKVYRPANHQINEIASHESVDAVFPFYLRNATINLMNRQDTRTVTVKLAKTEYDLNLTEFNEARLIQISIDTNQDPQIYIDNHISKALGLNLNDQVNINISGLDALTFTVTRIYENHGFYQNGVVFFYLSSQIEEAFIENDIQLRYEGIYVKSNDVVSTYSFLQTYVPLGNLLPLSYFGSQSEYDQYVINFMNQDYSSQIFVKNDVLNERELNNSYLLESANNQKIYAAIILGLGTLLISLKVLYGFKFAAKIEFYSSNSVIQKSKFLSTYLVSDVLHICITGLIIFMFNQSQSISTFTKAYMNGTIQLLLVVLFLGCLVNLLITVICSLSMNRNNLRREFS